MGHYYRACSARLGVEGAAKAERKFAPKGGDWLKVRAKGKGKFGKGGNSKGKDKKGVHAVDGGDEAQWESSAEWADEDWAEEEQAGTPFDEDDETIAAFCHCVDCPEL